MYQGYGEVCFCTIMMNDLLRMVSQDGYDCNGRSTVIINIYVLLPILSICVMFNGLFIFHDIANLKCMLDETNA